MKHAGGGILSKQRAWQLDRNRQGLCQCCGGQPRWRKPKGGRGVFCFGCRTRLNGVKNAVNAAARGALALNLFYAKP